MRKIALAFAAAAVVGLSAPAMARGAAPAAGLSAAQDELSSQTVVRKKVIVRRDRGWHRGWRHARPGVTKKVIIKRGPHGVVRKKVIVR